MRRIKNRQVRNGEHRRLFFTKHAPADHSRGIETQVFCKKTIHGLSLGRAEVVVLAGQVDILYVALCAIPAINIPDKGIFQPRAISGPVAVVREPSSMGAGRGPRAAISTLLVRCVGR